MAAARPVRIGCFREFQRSIQDSVHRLLCDQIELLQMPGFTATRTEIRHACGSLFLFEGLRHNITKIKSLEGIDVAWVEEAEHVSADSWDILIPTIRKPNSEIWVTFNPDQETDPTYQRFVLNTPPDTYLRKCSYMDNPWFPDTLRKEMEYLRRVDPDAAAHVWDGECRTMSDAQVLRGKWVVEDFEPLDTWAGPYYGADWGFSSDPTAITRSWIDNRTLYVEREAYRLGVEMDDLPDFFDTVPGIRKHTIRADNARPEIISHMKRRGFNIQAAAKWPGSVEDGISYLRSFERIVIHPRCKQTAQEARLWSYKTDRLSGDPLPALASGNEHAWDSIRYAHAPLIKRGPEIVMEFL
jgi:phage terminase large subunit